MILFPNKGHSAGIGNIWLMNWIHFAEPLDLAHRAKGPHPHWGWAGRSCTDSAARGKNEVVARNSCYYIKTHTCLRLTACLIWPTALRSCQPLAYSLSVYFISNLTQVKIPFRKWGTNCLLFAYICFVSRCIWMEVEIQLKMTKKPFSCYQLTRSTLNVPDNYI